MFGCCPLNSPSTITRLAGDGQTEVIYSDQSERIRLRRISETLLANPLEESSSLFYLTAHYAVVCIAWFFLLITLPFSIFFALKVVHEYERMIVHRLGTLRGNKPLGPGICIILPFIDDHHLIDMRTTPYDVPSQELLTADSVSVCVDAVVYFRTYDPVAAVMFVQDAQRTTKQLSQTTVRNVLSSRTLSQLLTDKDGIAQQAEAVLDECTCRWGVKVERVEVKDIRLNRELKRVLAAEAEAERAAEAHLISANGEFNVVSSAKLPYLQSYLD